MQQVLFEKMTKFELCKYISNLCHNIVHNLIGMHAELLQVKLKLKLRKTQYTFC